MNRGEILAIPSMTPGGLEAMRSAHFGRCDAFTLVEISEGVAACARVVPNVDHTEGGCLVPVEILCREGTTAILVGGIGMRPLEGFRGAGIDVFVAPGTTVAEAVEAYLSGLACPVNGSNVCGGHRGCQ